MAVTRECVVGRKIEREDQLGGLDWKSKCPIAAGAHRLLVLGLGEFDLCDPHGAALLPQMERAVEERLRRQQAN